MRRIVVELEVLASRFGDPALFPPGYSTAARFIDEPADANAWSIVIDQSEVLGTGPRSISQAHFLFDEAAPTRLTTPGVRFEMFEGATVVARGVMRGEHSA